LLVLIANLISWIPAYFFLTNWLQNFAYHEHISLFIFLISGISAVFIALLTVIFQAYRAAIANPATALKYE
jgi:ABC-type antimicrobial peptide transport system permease subunit